MGAVNRLRRTVMLLALLTVAGCATPQLDAVREGHHRLPVRAEVSDVPFYPQQAFYCGPAALAMALTWSGIAISQEELAPAVFTPGKAGSLRSDIVSAARRNGRLAAPVTGLPAMLAEIAAGRPVIVFQNLALPLYPQWHFAVAIGYDLDREELILHSGTRERHRMALDTFVRTWVRGDRWALLVLPPDQLPVQTDTQTAIDAAIGLERANRPAEAAQAYGAILRRWPLSGEAALGHGNALYAKGDFAAAATAFHRATIHSPDSPIPWNNLAMALAELNRRNDAIAAARRAIALAGDDAAPYRRTLQEISSRSL